MNKQKVVTVALVAAGLSISAAWAVGPYLFEDRDHVESIDSAEVREAAEPACARMHQRVEAAGTDEEKNQAVEAMVAEIRAVGPEALDHDRPTEAWLEDWERLIAARRAGDPVPRDGGGPIHRRMDELVKDLPPCQLPREFLPGRGGSPTG